MDEKQFFRLVEDLKEYDGIDGVFLLSPEGEILFTSGKFQLSSEEARGMLDTWKKKLSSIIFQEHRYAVIKNDEIQLAAKNTVDGTGNIAGSITKEGDYLTVHIKEKTDLILLEWSIFVNQIAWM